jgi:sugar phosphate isomerase/epimerase
VAARAGFKRVTVSPYAFEKALEAGWSEQALERKVAAAGLTVTMIDALSGALPGTPRAADLDPGVRPLLPPEALDPPDEQTCFRAASALGASVVNVTHYMGRLVPVDALAEALAGVCRRAAPIGLRVCLEAIPNSGVPDLAFAQSIVDACGEHNAAVLLDVFHFDRAGSTIHDIQFLPRGAIAGIQLSDRRRPPPGTPHVPMSGRLLPGEGELPLREWVEAALANSPEATVDLEVLNDELRGLPADEAAACLAASATTWRTTTWDRDLP